MNDMSGREVRAAVLPSKTRFPKLSPGFLTEEDAAYWVHGQIPANADREYGSVIVQLPDGDFAATQPVQGEVNTFDFRTILDTDANGNYVHPAGYTCVANVHSHPPALDKVRAANPGQDEVTLRLFLNFFSDMDFISDVSERSFFRSAYLSGPDGVLLKYSPSGTKEEFSYYLWLKAGAPRDNPVGVFGVANVIRKVASIGELKVIVSNADWVGSVGKVPPDWQPGKAFSKGVITEWPLMTRICGSAQQAVLAALKEKSARTSGLVLKKLAANEYIATQARPAGQASWDPVRFFPRGDDGRVKLPAGYVLEGFYYASRPDPALFPPIQAWLYENFFTPGEMATAIASQALSKPLSEAGKSLSLYMQARDSSILKYSFSGSEIEAALSVKKADGTFGDGGLQARMQAGTLRPREFVSTLALAGRLEVLRGSKLWDRLGPVGLDWAPFAAFPWPTLSPAFLSVDDAARYVHERIGNWRDRQYAGYIFQRDDKRFIATEPLEGGIESVSPGQFYPSDNKGRLIFPIDHVLVGRYVSHEALSRLDPGKVDRLKWSRQEAALSLQTFSVEEMRQVLLDEMPLYLSGAQKSLVKFEPAETTGARDLEKRLGSAKQPGPLVAELETGVAMPSNFIREQAAAGRLSVVVNSELWGERGPVTAAWSVPASPWKWIRPRQVAFGAVFSSADDAALDRYFHDVRLHDQEKAWFGFILKQQDREEYVASELIPVSDETNNVFQAESLFGVTSTPHSYRYPESFNGHAFFYSRQRVKHPSDKSGSWLSQYFISPDDLYIAVYYSRRRPVTEPDTPIPLYISTQDGALLKFENRRGSKLFDNDTPSMGLEDIKRNLASGRLPAVDFVRLVASHGQLNVMRTSLCWDRPWPVDLHWQPFMNLERRWLSPAFSQQDDAVAYVQSRLPDHSNKLLGGVVLKRGDGLYLATDPVEVPQEDFDVQLIFPDESIRSKLFPEGCHVVARYRARRAAELPLVFAEIQKQTYLNMLSVDTLYSAFTRPGAKLSEYLFGPDGSLIRYDAGVLSRLRADLSNILTDNQRLPADLDGKKIKQQIHSGALTPSDWVDSLAQAGYLHVVTGSRLWGSSGPVTRWAPYPAVATGPVGDYDKAVAAPACSPAFIQQDAAARYVNEGPRHTWLPTFGFILWNARDGVFTGTLPVENQHSRMALDRVFPESALPDGYAVQALYLRSAAAPEGVQEDDPRQFIPSPILVQQVCTAAYTSQGYKPVYFSCADGALLRFDMAAFEPGEFYDAFGQVELRPNQFSSLERARQDEHDYMRGRLDQPGYIQRMARAGKLEVIVTSAYWSRHGVVDEKWQPRLADAPDSERWAADPVPALGPIFHHADDAARYIQQRAGSVEKGDTGFESAILSRTSSLLSRTSRFVPLEPLASTASGESPVTRIFRKANDPLTTRQRPSPRYPDGYTLVASHQLYLSGNTTLVPDIEQVYANFASPSMVREHTRYLKDRGFAIKDFYYSTPHGVLLRYTPVYTHAENDLLSMKAVEFKDGAWQAQLSSGDFISRLIDLGDFRVLIAGYYWKQSGRMGVKWRERRHQSPGLGIVWHRDEL
ncbi:DUF4329 domain-containing protein [Pseudomonas sp. SDO5532_S415]